MRGSGEPQRLAGQEPHGVGGECRGGRHARGDFSAPHLRAHLPHEGLPRLLGQGFRHPRDALPGHFGERSRIYRALCLPAARRRQHPRPRHRGLEGRQLQLELLARETVGDRPRLNGRIDPALGRIAEREAPHHEHSHIAEPRWREYATVRGERGTPRDQAHLWLTAAL